MANRNFPSNKLYNFHVMPVKVDMQIAIAGSGAPTLSQAPGVKSITRLAAGVYQIQLQDNYYALLGMDHNIIEPVTGSAIDPNTGVVGSPYQISTVGDTNWTTAGVPASITPAVGVTFILTTAPSAGTGRVKLISASNIDKIELIGQLQNSIAPSQSNGTNGAIIVVRTLQAQIAAATAQGTALQYIAADPTNGSVLELRLHLNNSSVQ